MDENAINISGNLEIKKIFFTSISLALVIVYPILFISPIVYYKGQKVPIFPAFFYISGNIIVLLSLLFFAMNVKKIEYNIEGFRVISYYTERILLFYIILNFLLLITSVFCLVLKLPIDRRNFPYGWIIFTIVIQFIITTLLHCCYIKMVKIGRNIINEIRNQV